MVGVMMGVMVRVMGVVVRMVPPAAGVLLLLAVGELSLLHHSSRRRCRHRARVRPVRPAVHVSVSSGPRGSP